MPRGAGYEHGRGRAPFTVTYSSAQKGGVSQATLGASTHGWRLTGLPSPMLTSDKHVACRVLVAVHDQPAVRAAVRAYAEAPLHALATPATVLGGVPWGDHFHSLAGPFCLAGEDPSEGRPPRVLDRPVETSLAASPRVCIPAAADWFGGGTARHVGDLQVFEIDHVIVAHQGVRRLVVTVAALPLGLLVLLGALPHHLPPSLAARLAAGHTTVCRLQRALDFSVMTGILNVMPLCCHHKHLHSYVNARLCAGEGPWCGGHRGTAEAGVPAIRLPAHRDGLGRALQWTM